MVVKTSDSTNALKSGTDYVFTVRCLSDDGKSYVSAYDKTGKTILYLSVPELIKAVNTAKGVTVSWKEVPGATSYLVYYKGEGAAWSGTKRIETTETSHTFTGGSSGKTYVYTVRAVKDSTVSSYNKNGVSALKLSIPTVSMKNTTNGITVSWDKISGANGYYVYRKESGGSYKVIATIKSGSTVSYSDTAVKSNNNVAYTYTVRAFNGSTKSYYTGKNIVRLTTPTISSASNSAAGKITVKWNKNSGATGYQVYYKVGSTGKTLTVENNSTLSAVISDLTKGNTYSVVVRSYKTVSGVNYYSGWSSVKKVTINK